VHRVLGIVNGTTNFVLTEMERGKSYDEALDDAKRHGYAEADPTDDVSGADAAAKMAILATVAFNSRVDLADVDYLGITDVDLDDVAAARDLDMVIRLVGAARLVDGGFDVRVQPALVDKQHPLAKVNGAFNAVMLQGDAIREITLQGPGAGGIETASAVIADMVSVIGTMGTGFLQNDPVWRTLPRLKPGENRSPFYFHLSVDDRPGVLARVAEALAEREVSVARLLQHANGDGAALHVVTHEARQGALDEALATIAAMEEVRRKPLPFPVVSDRGIAELGWA
jgi:homoserine dehydrogenase